MLSEKFRAAIKLSPIPAYRLAIEVGINPSTLSQWMIGSSKPKSGDDRVIRIGQLVGLKPHEIFTEEKVA